MNSLSATVLSLWPGLTDSLTIVSSRIYELSTRWFDYKSDLLRRRLRNPLQSTSCFHGDLGGRLLWNALIYIHSTRSKLKSNGVVLIGVPWHQNECSMFGVGRTRGGGERMGWVDSPVIQSCVRDETSMDDFECMNSDFGVTCSSECSNPVEAQLNLRSRDSSHHSK